MLTTILSFPVLPAQLAALAAKNVMRQTAKPFASIELAQDDSAPVFVIEVVQDVQHFLDATQLGQSQLHRPVLHHQPPPGSILNRHRHLGGKSQERVTVRIGLWHPN
jgi:hypothetical protein